MTAPERSLAVRGSGPVGARLAVVLLLAGAGLWSAVVLGLDPSRLWPDREGWALAAEFFGRAASPALTHEGVDVPADTAPLLVIALRAALRTLAFAAAAMLPALLLGLLLGFGGSTAWWADHRERGRRRGGSPGARLRATVGPLVSLACRLVAVVLRSVHELLWAVLFLAAFGITPLAALVAIALPYGGVLAKVFAEMIDEAPRQPAGALREVGAGPVPVFLFGLLPRALPDMTAYALYRFECGLRSAAVLGFFGFPTLGYHIAASFENLYYGEVWTYLYVLVTLVVLVDWWSGQVRRRLVR
jgi:phosphonate transport system permease protein